MSKLAKPFLVLCGAAFVLIGANTFVDPLAAMTPVELNVDTVSARNELRANYGGLQLGMGLLLLAGFREPRITASALLAQALLVGGLAVGRATSIALDGLPNTFVLGLLAVEATTAIVSLALFRLEWAKR